MTEPAAPPPAAPGPPAAPAPEPAGPLTPAEEIELGELIIRRDEAEAGADAQQMKVEPPHASISYGGVTVGTEYTTVPGHMVAGIATAADEAGVTITIQES